MNNKIKFILLMTMLYCNTSFPQGEVYLVIGSDTAIWDGMNTAQFNCTYDPGLFSNPSMNAYKVINPSFRNQFRDTYGTPMKMTWWMMAGNIFRYAANMNVPLANTITIYQMKKYHSENIKLLGDELSLHYHTFAWTDYNNDSKYYWNQAKNFSECLDDFNITLAHFLLEENTFPVSFRTGWHYMDNEWQNYIDGIIPYSLHNDYPNIRVDNVEPTDNNYDWSKASSEFVPYHPAHSDYQLPGDGKSWNTRSRFMGSVSQTLMDQIFAKADKGVDQVPCFWAHLPEIDFPDNMKRIDSLAHRSAAKYPRVNFRYCTAVEAMQRWRKGNDITPPAITMEEISSGTDVKFKVYSNEDIFQTKPFIAVKNINEEYFIADCIKLNDYCWITKESFPRHTLAKAGAAITDKMGNLSTKFINYFPDDIFIDNLDDEYIEQKGNWSDNSKASWGTNSRKCLLTAADTAIVEWNPELAGSGLFNLWIQVPEYSNAADKILFRVVSAGTIKNLGRYDRAFSSLEWNYIGTCTLIPGDKIQMIAIGSEQPGKVITADVLKLSALVKSKSIFVKGFQIQSNTASEKDSITFQLEIQNHGTRTLHVNSIHSVKNYFLPAPQFPLPVQGMSSIIIPVIFYSATSGAVQDTLIILSDDPAKPSIRFPYNVQVSKYFKIIDNEDSSCYSENGTWATSNAKAWGISSRYCWGGTNGWAEFNVKLRYPGSYEVSFIVPKTQNALTKALYIIKEASDTITVKTVDQNHGSGEWVTLGTFNFQSDKLIEVILRESNEIETNKVLRADAIKFQLRDLSSVNSPSKISNTSFQLMQNYPNPFNPETKIVYYLESTSDVELQVFNSLGQSVARYTELNQPAGEHKLTFNAAYLSSGIYFYTIKVKRENISREFRDVKKMILLR